MIGRYIESVEKDADGVTFITPRNVLREKIGYGGLDPIVIERAETYIRENKIDFHPYAIEFMEKLSSALDAARAMPERTPETKKAITVPIMRIKAGGGMFHYNLLTEISDIILGFLEGLDTLNNDALEIVGVYQKIMDALVGGKLTGDGGKTGRALADELYSACFRYSKKHGEAAGKK